VWQKETQPTENGLNRDGSKSCGMLDPLVQSEYYTSHRKKVSNLGRESNSHSSNHKEYMQTFFALQTDRKNDPHWKRKSLEDHSALMH